MHTPLEVGMSVKVIKEGSLDTIIEGKIEHIFPRYILPSVEEVQKYYGRRAPDFVYNRASHSDRIAVSKGNGYYLVIPVVPLYKFYVDYDEETYQYDSENCMATRVGENDVLDTISKVKKTLEKLGVKNVDEKQRPYRKRTIREFLGGMTPVYMADFLAVKLGTTGEFFIYKNFAGSVTNGSIVDEKTYLELLEQAKVPLVLSDLYIDLSNEFEKYRIERCVE